MAHCAALQVNLDGFAGASVPCAPPRSGRNDRAVTDRSWNSPTERQTLLYPELFQSLERTRWSLGDDVPWDAFDASQLDDPQTLSMKTSAITEWSALPATEMLLRDNRHDTDFSAFLSVWFYEEQKHALVLMECLRRAEVP
jgi:hypothetical protein